MGLEIERKYLVNLDRWNTFDKPKGELYEQGYISTDPNCTIRVRVTPDGAYITIKGLTTI
jgi:CYTH domain-containing protein